MSKVLCDVYKSRKKDEAYIYVSRQGGLEKIPEALLEMFGKPQLAMTLIITADKQLARYTGAQILEAIDNQGFFLQMPPPKEETGLPDLFCKRDDDNA
ncbi:YcgL domain-containing protein [Oceanobacter mangrovi]|uniref:YcgL domain-containing protein n=1 Tax=Oceanobacter mangrovi TaxID=2862510 RepID=UPI001C8EE467|nr:YcgL domain-containing protein [Oceanobacter mangrovi]